jgi:predicted acetyltransferase
MKLVEPSAIWDRAFLEMASDYAAAGEHRYLRALDDFSEYLRTLEERRKGEGSPRAGSLARSSGSRMAASSWPACASASV